jgi:hypothetical protein
MPTDRWNARRPPQELGVVVHGPVVLARSPGIAVGLRCVFAHPTGLHLPLVLLAEGVQAEAAVRHSRSSEPAGPTLRAEVDGQDGRADATRSAWTGSTDHFELQADHWIGALPADARLTLVAGWPEAGLAEQRTVLTLAHLDDLADQVVTLR